MQVGIAADHGGFALKAQLVAAHVLPALSYADYVNAVLDKLINWDFAAANLH